MLLRIVIIAVSCLYTLIGTAQVNWDSKKCDYTNHIWNFHWNFEEELEWELSQGNEKHTVFKVTSPYGILAFVNINPHPSTAKGKVDLWSSFDDYKKVLTTSWSKVEERTGGKVTPIKVEKCRFFGENAVKIIVKSEIHDDVVDEISYGYTYSFIKDGATWNVSVKVAPEVWEAVGESGVKELFINMGPNAK